MKTKTQAPVPVYVELEVDDGEHIDWDYGKGNQNNIPAQKHPSMKTVIPKADLKRWAKRARSGAKLKLQNLVEFRAIPLQQYKEDGVLMDAYREASEAMMISVSSLRRDMWIIRDYPTEQLEQWLAEGLSFDHIENANMVADAAKSTPEELLKDAVEKGGLVGNKPMTADNLVSYALGWREYPEKVYKVLKYIGLIVKVSHSLGWDEQRMNAFQQDLTAFQKRWFEQP